MRILFLSQRVPYPPNRGDKITTWRLVERLGRSHEVRIVAFAHDDGDLDAAEVLRKMGFPTTAVRYHDRAAKLGALPLLLSRKPLTLGVYGSRAVQAAVDELAPDSDLAYAYSSSMGAFLERHPRLPRIMHFGELDSDKWRQYAQRSRPPMSWVYAREHRTLLEFERRIARSFSANVVCTPLEKEILERAIPGATAEVLRNGVDLAYFVPRWEGREPGRLVFTGVMNYLPNSEGVSWFVRAILPLVRRQAPEATLSIVGAHPTPEVRRLAEVPGVEVTGFVPDTRVWLGKASVSVAPLRIARGIQNKVLEAMAMGLPVVGTTCATQGVEGVDGLHFRVRDDPEGFAREVADLVREPDKALALGRAARAFVEAHDDWEVVFRPLDALVARCAGGARPGAR
ncbi:MAG: TIGR03087 family PEP-CTERM/XrtA system glycosyltransferase [Planctomycetes bacterium]|nr:TIGR03087 family PEP-CTERM/XrtA system glycosyltransferase [Planctomycetota bacterium]